MQEEVRRDSRLNKRVRQKSEEDDGTEKIGELGTG